MKRSIIAAGLLTAGLLPGMFSFCQEHPLPNNYPLPTIDLPQKIIEYSQSEQAAMYEFTRKFKSRLKSGYTDEMDSIPLTLYIVRKSDGTGQGATLEEIQEYLDSVNYYFHNASMHFYICQDITYVDDDQHYSMDWATGYTAFMDEYYRPNTLPFVCTNEVLFNGLQVGGSGYVIGFPGYYPGIVMVYVMLKYINTFVHEMAHIFHLQHTHGKYAFPDDPCYDGGWDDPVIPEEVWCKGAAQFDNNEDIDLNSDGIPDCAQTGDDICDTPAEPNLFIDSLTDGCNYVGHVTDYYGDTLHPVVGNFMSYGPCQDHLSTGQYARIRYVLENYGSYMINAPCDIAIGLASEKGTRYSIYPNPSTGLVNISSESGIRMIRVMDIQGKLLKLFRCNTTHKLIDLSQLDSGMYLIQIMTGSGNETVLFEKINQ